jgi:hypothetical protein
LLQDDPIAALQWDAKPTNAPPKKPVKLEQPVAAEKDLDVAGESLPPAAPPAVPPKGDFCYESIQLALNKLQNNDLSSSSEPVRKDQLRCAVVLNHFINLWVTLQRKRLITPPDEYMKRFYGTPAAIGLRFLELFATAIASDDADNGGASRSAIKYALSQANRDCCHVHLLLFYLMADGGTSMRSDNIRALADDLKMDPAKAMHLLRQAGCKVKKDKGKITAYLLTPLTFPATKRGG